MTDEQLILKMILDESGFSAGLNSATKKLGQFDGEVGRASQSGGAKMGSIWTTFVGNFLASGATKIIAGGMNMIKSSIDGAVSRFDTMKKFPAVMTTLGYSTDEVDRSINKLSDGIDGLPTRLDEIVANTQSLAMATGSLDKGTDSAIALNNAFLASGSSSADASRGLVQYTQMLSKGKVDMQSWNSLQDTMGLALQKTGEAFGFAGKTAKTDLYNALQEGTITFDQFNDKIIELGDGVGGFAELAKKNSEGIATSFANIRSAVVKGLANVITTIDSSMKESGLGSIAENFDRVKGLINKTFTAINATLTTVVPVIANVIKSLNGLFEPFKKSKIIGDSIWVFDMFKDSLTKMFGSISEQVPKFIEVFQKLTSFLQPIFENLSFTVSIWAVTFQRIFQNVIPVAIDILRGVFDGFISFIGPIFTTLTDVLADVSLMVTNVILDVVIPAFEKLGEWLKNHEGVVKAFGVALGFIATQFLAFKAVTGVISVFDNVTATFKTVKASILGIKTAIITAKNAITGLKSAFTVLSAVMNVNPFVLLATAVIGVGAALIYFWKTNEGFRDFVKIAWEVIKNTIIGAWEGIKNAWTKTTEFFSNLWVQIKETAVNAWNSFVEAIQIILQPFSETFMSYWNNMSSGLSQIWEGIKQYATGAWEMIKNIILAPILLLVDLVTGDFEGMKNHISQIWENIKNAASLMWTGMKNILGGIVSATVGVIKAHWENFKNFIGNLWNGIKTTASNVWTGIKNTVSNLVTGAVNGIRDAWTKAVDWTKEKFGAIKNTIMKIKDINLFEIGKNIIQGLIDGIGSLVNKVKDKIGEVASGIKDKITSALHIKSPSRWMRDMIGKNMMLGLAIGIDQNASEAIDSVSKAVGAVKDKLSNDDDYSFSRSLELVSSKERNQHTVTSKAQSENQKTEIHIHLTSYGMIPESNLIKQAKQLAQILKQQMDLDQAAVGGV